MPVESNVDSYRNLFYDFLCSAEIQAAFVKKKALSVDLVIKASAREVSVAKYEDLLKYFKKVQATGEHSDFADYAEQIYKATDVMLYTDGVVEYIVACDKSYMDISYNTFFVSIPKI